MNHPDYSSDDSEDDDGGGLSLSAETMAALRDFALASGIPTLGTLSCKVDCEDSIQMSSLTSCASFVTAERSYSSLAFLHGPVSFHLSIS
jgi:hypothetical protein